MAAAATMCAILVGASPGFAAEPLKIRIAYGAVPGTITPLLFQNKEILRHYGKRYVVDAVQFRSTAVTLQALAAKEVDIAYIAFGSLASAVLNARLDIKVVSDLAQWGANGHQGPVYMVLADSGIKTPADLKGKVLATNGRGGGLHTAMVAMLKKAGLKENEDYTVVEVRFPAMEATLRSKQADLITVLQPFLFDIKAKGGTRDLFKPEDSMGTVQALVNVGRTEFLKANREVLVDFFEDYLRALRWYLDPANHKEAVKIVAAFNKHKDARYEGWAFSKRDFYRDPNGLPDLAALQRNIDTIRDLGIISKTFDVKEHVDLSLLQEAAKRLK
jgi:NitT/TauT family transport system substrate-binding protein